ncbi:prefoldin, alpha subunit [Fonticula alba]|uniref:Prefoldin, alpha subunit n=1 Tax=Fonticula alba TaxID=691883 RepID=A0A058ZE38_FONAL|nr:prefoldin, alpha subunit [Fonticula alba]KCV72188.1 prefoldin, alpha subunit [Fonticula alba]|eukprot:XP_009493766.1 prefoldin, alpha subunit [Fonticula alba]
MATSIQDFDLSRLTLGQLQEAQRQMSQEINMLTSSYSVLRESKMRFLSSAAALSVMKPDNKDKNIMLPITTSLYVPGTLTDVNHVLVDVGTDYFIKMSVTQAASYYERKDAMLDAELAQLNASIQQAQQNMQVLVEFMQAKAFEIEYESRMAKEARQAAASAATN